MVILFSWNTVGATLFCFVFCFRLFHTSLSLLIVVLIFVFMDFNFFVLIYIEHWHFQESNYRRSYIERCLSYPKFSVLVDSVIFKPFLFAKVSTYVYVFCSSHFLIKKEMNFMYIFTLDFFPKNNSETSPYC
jgi:hypothetical protein